MAEEHTIDHILLLRKVKHDFETENVALEVLEPQKFGTNSAEICESACRELWDLSVRDSVAKSLIEQNAVEVIFQGLKAKYGNETTTCRKKHS